METESEPLLQLEEKVAHLQLAVDEISNELFLRTKRIAELEKKIKLMESRLVAVEDGAEGDPANTRPPHW